MFSPELIALMNEITADGEGWWVCQHPELYREAERLVREGKAPEAVAAEAAHLFDLGAGDEAHVLAVLREHAAECERYRTTPTILRWPG